jgi:hypothetical protein
LCAGTSYSAYIRRNLPVLAEEPAFDAPCFRISSERLDRATGNQDKNEY